MCRFLQEMRFLKKIERIVRFSKLNRTALYSLPPENAISQERFLMATRNPGRGMNQPPQRVYRRLGSRTRQSLRFQALPQIVYPGELTTKAVS